MKFILFASKARTIEYIRNCRLKEYLKSSGRKLNGGKRRMTEKIFNARSYRIVNISKYRRIIL